MCGICDNIPSKAVGMTIGHESRKALRACPCASTSAAQCGHTDK